MVDCRNFTQAAKHHGMNRKIRILCIKRVMLCTKPSRFGSLKTPLMCLSNEHIKQAVDENALEMHSRFLY